VASEVVFELPPFPSKEKIIIRVTLPSKRGGNHPDP
jgi:hypothetical protein